MDSPKPLRPFLKWPGGKRWAAARIAVLVRAHLADSGQYFEPFLGGGAVFFHLCPSRACIGDLNRDLIDAYRAVRDSPAEVRGALRRLPLGKAAYDRIRAAQPRSKIGRTARFLYLNRMAFGGIYRVNQEGRFNVPYGGGDRTPQVLWETDILDRASQALQLAAIWRADFDRLLARAGQGDVVYCDPTYTVAHDNNGFVRYNERNFSWLDQERLAGAALEASRRGATVIVSNAHHHSIARLYPQATKLRLSRTSRVSSDPKGRGPVTEYLLVLKSAKR